MAYRLYKQSTKRHFSQWQYTGDRILLACCDCGMVHQIRFKLDKGLHMRVRVHQKATQTLRKKKKFKCHLTT
jgi:uncharacterized Zn finger protein